jgi:hypothetical protein
MVDYDDGGGGGSGDDGGTPTCLQLGYTWQKTRVTKSYIRETFKI